MDEPDGLVVPARRERRHADAHRRRQHLRGAAAAVRGAARDGRRQARPRPALPPEGALRAARAWARRCGSTTRISASTTTCATPPCPRPAARSSCARWPRACSPSTSTATSRCGRCGWSRASSDGRWALLSKVHHCMVDGVAATDLMSVMFSDDDRPRAAGASVAPAPGALGRRGPARARSPRAPARPGSCDALRARAERAARDAALAARRLARPRPRAAACARSRVLADRPDRAAPPLELGRRPAQRRQDGPRRARRHRQRRRADDHHERLPRRCSTRAARRSAADRVVRTMVPVSVRRRGEHGVYNNRVSAVFARLPGRARGPGRAPRSDPRRDGRDQGVQAGGRRRRAHLAVGLRAAAAARARQPPRDASRRA